MSANLMDLTVIVRYLFGPNTLPITQLLLKSNMQAIETAFAFQMLQVDADTNQFRLLAGGGEFNGIPVLHLTIDANSINLGVSGDNADLAKVYEALRAFLIQIDPKKRMDKPSVYATTYQTQSTVHLSVPFASLLSKKFLGFLDSKKQALKPEACSAVDIQLSNLSFQLKYTCSNPVVSFLPKTLTIEPRAGSDPNENLYFITTPTDADLHQAIVEDFQKSMSKAS